MTQNDHLTDTPRMVEVASQPGWAIWVRFEDGVEGVGICHISRTVQVFYLHGKIELFLKVFICILTGKRQLGPMIS